jgi:hypothetical protein
LERKEEQERRTRSWREPTNNRRATILAIHTATETVSLRWNDVIQIYNNNNQQQQQQQSTPSPPPLPPIETYDISLSFYEFAFHFSPGFCITAHMAQGETIREHYAVLEWEEMRTQPRMAYVALTRASAAEFLHILPHYHSNPWNTDADTHHEFENILTKLFHAFRWDRNQTYNIDASDVEQKIKNTTHCAWCRTVPLRYTGYHYKSADQFAVMSSDRSGSLTPENCILVCNGCRANNRKQPRGDLALMQQQPSSSIQEEDESDPSAV